MIELDVLTADISKAYDDLRNIEESIISLSGKERFGASRRRTIDSSRSNNYGYERRDGRVVSLDSLGPNKRRLVISAENDLYEGSSKRLRYDEKDDENMRHTVQSSVVMPAIETKSRKAAISELKGSEKKEVNVRNRRMFSNLLLGTLQRFQKEEKKISSVEKAEKQKEVERRLRESEEEERERLARERAALLGKRREKERLIKSLQRKKAIIQYAEQKQEHYRKLQNFIQTQAKPPIFYLPAKHTLRTLELLKVSSKKIDDLIEHRRLQMEADLKTPEEKQVDEEEDNCEHSQDLDDMHLIGNSVVKDISKLADNEQTAGEEFGDEDKDLNLIGKISMESSLQNVEWEKCENGEETPRLKQLVEDEENTGKDNSHSDIEPLVDEAEIDQDDDSQVASADEND
ncbi:unnamed protein product [Thelazia callipaeda]|uniref:Pinin_SDK_memA domain-containing protein n=1 Tax=Thelazia callipaeda TaxID=103827 RepID=A0A0N5CWI2_THECL|nr:unnamed protein product [Thelazia callipaeda]